MKKLLMALILIVVLISLGACADNKGDSAQSQDNNIASTTLISSKPIIREEFLTDGDNQYSVITVNGLELTGGSNQAAGEKINGYILQLSDAYINEIKAVDSISHDADTSTKFTHSRDFAVLYQDSNIISIGVDCYDYTDGAAHPYVGRLAYSFDLASGEVKTAEDYLGERAAEQIAADIYAQIEQDGNIADFDPNLQENLLGNFGDGKWYAAKECLMIIYNPYEIAAYAAGILEFKIEYTL